MSIMGSVLRLDQIDASMAWAVGGKGANLGRLRAAGLPVPDGFCVTTDAYRQVVGSVLDDLLEGLAVTQRPDELARLAAEARQRVVSAPVPSELEAELVSGYARLGSGPVAVRSSATAEDLASASFAGQQDTYLNVVGKAALVDAVRRCWASLWTDRAVSYRNTAGVDHTGVALSVVVQEMVQAAAAGVMFTANPVTGTRHQTVIDASPGLGEAVVSGLVNPDHYVVDTRSGDPAAYTLVQRRLGDKRVRIDSLTSGGTERVHVADASDRAALDDEQLLALAALGAQVQREYGAPQDTEWAVDAEGTLWLTQARPITTLYPLVGEARPQLRAYLCLTLAQGLTRPITPMGLSAFRQLAAAIAAAAGLPALDPGADPQRHGAVQVAGQRLFADLTEVLRNPIARRAALAGLSVMEARAAVVLGRLAEQPEFSLRRGQLRLTLTRVGRIVAAVRVPQRMLTALVSPEAAYRQIAALEVSLRRDLDLAGDLGAEQRLDEVQRLLRDRVFWFMPTVVSYCIPGFALLALGRRLLAGLLDPGELQGVLRGLPHNVTTEMDLALWRLSQQIARDPASRSAFDSSTAAELALGYAHGELPLIAQEGLAAFLESYGHRAVAEIDLGMPRWADDPTHLVGMLTNYLRLDDPALAPDAQFRAGAAAADQLVATLAQRARGRSRVRGKLVDFSLGRTRQLAGLRESPKNLAVLALAGIRRQLQMVGAELVAGGRIVQADDIFFLDLTEARRAVAGADLLETIAGRKAAYAEELRRRHIPRILLSDGTEPEASALAVASAAGALTGSPASAGTVTGRARVILDPVGAHLEPGEILVAPSTDPGWTPLFLTAGGLVMEMGGSNSHGAVVAREYGIPAVVGVADATLKIDTGDMVTVDGAAGLVLPQEERADAS